jgi:hypothetical protein
MQEIFLYVDTTPHYKLISFQFFSWIIIFTLDLCPDFLQPRYYGCFKKLSYTLFLE